MMGAQNAIWMYNSPHDWCDQDEDVVGRVRQVARWAMWCVVA